MKQENQFSPVADKKENTLRETEEKLDSVMENLAEKKYGEMLDKMISESAQHFSLSIKKAVPLLNNIDHSERLRRLRLLYDFHISKVPPIAGNIFLHELLNQEQWKAASKEDPLLMGSVFSFVLRALQGKHELFEKERKEEENDPSPIETLCYSFNEQDFPSAPDFFGESLPEYTKLSFTGDTGINTGRGNQGGEITVIGNTENDAGSEMQNGKLLIIGNTTGQTGVKMENGEIVVKGNSGSHTGKKMEGGKITILGSTEFSAGDKMKGGILHIRKNTSAFVGHEMKDGQILIEGNAGNAAGTNMAGGMIKILNNCGIHTGIKMKGGTLDIRGNVASFDKTAFEEKNKGTIIWKKVKIWENGDWTPEGAEMYKKGEIIIQ